MTDVVRARLPWTVVGASVLLALLLAYTLFGAYDFSIVFDVLASMAGLPASNKTV